MNTPNRDNYLVRFCANLSRERGKANLSQKQLAQRAGVSRSIVARIELGLTDPPFSLVLQLAAALRLPLERLMTGSDRPTEDLAGLAFELYHLGIRDLRVTGERPPGAFRQIEEILPLVLQGDRPEPRIVDAVPYILAHNSFDPGLMSAFAQQTDYRVRRRLAWLCDVTLVITKTYSWFDGTPYPQSAERFMQSVERPATTDPEDSMGHPADQRPSLLWRRWKISYAGNLDSFLLRATELRYAAEIGE